MRLIFSGAGVLALAFAAACGVGAAPETDPETDAGMPAFTSPVAAQAPKVSVCQNLERIVLARSDSPAFSGLPDDFALRDGVACAAADRTIRAGAGQTPVTLSGYTCVFSNEPGGAEDAAWPVWQAVLADASECGASRWTMMTDTDTSASARTRRVLLHREADAPQLLLPEGPVEPVRFEWSQDGAQTILLFVAAP